MIIVQDMESSEFLNPSLAEFYDRKTPPRIRSPPTGGKLGSLDSGWRMLIS